MSKIKYEFKLFIDSDTNNHPTRTPFEIAQMIQNHLHVILKQNGIGYNNNVVFQGYQYIDPVDEPSSTDVPF